MLKLTFTYLHSWMVDAFFIRILHSILIEFWDCFVISGPICFPIVGCLFQILKTAGITGLLTDKSHRISQKYGPFAWFETGYGAQGGS